MAKIPGEAILFDMYYNGKDFAESDKNPKIEVKAVTEETPQFRNFYIRNITCYGAENAIVVRGLPEMNVQNILIENSTISARNGIYCIEGSNIQFKNLRITTNTDEVGATVSNSKNLLFDKVVFEGKMKKKQFQIFVVSKKN